MDQNLHGQINSRLHFKPQWLNESYTSTEADAACAISKSYYSPPSVLDVRFSVNMRSNLRMVTVCESWESVRHIIIHISHRVLMSKAELYTYWGACTWWTTHTDVSTYCKGKSRTSLQCHNKLVEYVVLCDLNIWIQRFSYNRSRLTSPYKHEVCDKCKNIFWVWFFFFCHWEHQQYQKKRWFIVQSTLYAAASTLYTKKEKKWVL